jgi:hypothetical protein
VFFRRTEAPDGLCANAVAVVATGSWTISRWGQFTGSEALDKAYVPFFGAFGAAWDDAMVARWSAQPARHVVAGDGGDVADGNGGPVEPRRGDQWSTSHSVNKVYGSETAQKGL